MLYAISIYLHELKWRFIYTLLSSFICTLILLNDFQILVLLEVFPLFQVSHRRFIATHVTDLFDSFLLICFYLSLIWIFPLVVWQIRMFLSPAWTKSQLWFLEMISNLLWICFNLFVFIYHFKCIPLILNFMLAWEIKDKYSYIKLEIESRASDYLFWILKTNISFSISWVWVVFIFMVLLLFLGPIFLCFKVKFYWKQIIIIIFVIFYFLLPLDFKSQILFFAYLVIFYEIIFLILCFMSSKLIHD